MQATLLSALFAGLVAILVTVAIERWGGLIGGILGTLPTTIVPATIGMMVEGGEANLATSLAMVPAGMLLNALFVGAWVVYPRWRGEVSVGHMTAVALTLWFGLAILLTMLTPHILVLAGEQMFAISGTFLLIGLGLTMTWHPAPTPRGRNPVTLRILLLRGLAAAIAIGVAVEMAATGEPVIAGLASVFPAIFLTTMVALWIAQGSEVPTGAAGPMMLGGSSVAAYSLLTPWALASHGLIIGSIITWILAVLTTSLPAYGWMQWRQTRSPPSPTSV